MFALKRHMASVAILLAALAPPCFAEVHTVSSQDAAGGGAWASVGALLATGTVQGGDEIELLAGEYGNVTIRGARFERPVTIRPAQGGAVHLTGLTVADSSNLTFEDLQIWPDAPGKGHLVQAGGSTSRITFVGLDIRGRRDAEAYRRWSRQDWLTYTRPGLLLRGSDSAVLDSRFTGLGGGLGVTGPRARIEGNLIRGFSRDGINVAGVAAVLRGNRIEDCIKIDDSHDDGIQAWSLGPDRRPGMGILDGLVIEDNVILEWRGRDSGPLTCSLQGIGLFDGMFSNLSIRNNVISVSAYHGIAVAGALDSQIVNNTVIHSRLAGRNNPWIRVSDHRDGRVSRNVIVANNIAPKITVVGTSLGVTLSQNLQDRYPARRLVAPYDAEFMPTAESGLTGAADPAHAPALDIDGHRRSGGNGPDIGAVERP